MTKTKSPKQQARDLRDALHYWQMMVRLDIRSLKMTRAKCKEVAAKLREVQKVTT